MATSKEEMAREIYVALVVAKDGALLHQDVFAGLAEYSYMAATEFQNYKNKKEADEAAKYADIIGN